MSRYTMKVKVTTVWQTRDNTRYAITFENKPSLPRIILDADTFFFLRIARHIDRNLGYPASIDFKHFLAEIDKISDEVFEIKFSFPITLRSVRT